MNRQIEVKQCCRNCHYGKNLKVGDYCNKAKFNIISTCITVDCRYYVEKNWASPSYSKYQIGKG